MIKQPRILLWDIETSIMSVASFTLYPNYISHEAILKDWEIIGAAWKWFGEKPIYTAYHENEYDRIVAIRKAVEEADIIVAHNNDKFDLKMLNARIAKHGLPPLPKKVTIDTLKVAKKEFRFTSNKLDYLARFFGLGTKLSTGGIELWLKVLAGDKKAIKHMEKYNKQDVVLLEQVYIKLRPYISNHPNMNIWAEEKVCPNCGTNNLKKEGIRHTQVAIYQRYKCGNCHAYCQGAKVGTTKEIK